MCNMVKDHCLKLVCNPLLFHNYKQFNIKVCVAYHSIIDMKAAKLLAKGANEMSGGVAGFSSHSNVSWVP